MTDYSKMSRSSSSDFIRNLTDSFNQQKCALSRFETFLQDFVKIKSILADYNLTFKSSKKSVKDLQIFLYYFQSSDLDCKIQKDDFQLIAKRDIEISEFSLQSVESHSVERDVNSIL